MNGLLEKIKHFLGRAMAVGEADAQHIAEAAVPLFEHFTADVEAIVVNATDSVKVDAEALAASLKPVLKDAVREILVELGVGSSGTGQPS